MAIIFRCSLHCKREERVNSGMWEREERVNSGMWKEQRKGLIAVCGRNKGKG